MKLTKFYFSIYDSGISVNNTIADFNFQSYYFSHYIEKRVKNEKIETDNFNMILFKGSLNPKKDIYRLDKCLVIEIPFDLKKYKRIYPFENEYPIVDSIFQIDKEKEFGDFLYEFGQTALQKAVNLNAKIPVEQLTHFFEDFRKNSYSNIYNFKSKKINSEISAHLESKITCNFFLLELFLKKGKTIISKEILKTLPNSVFYKDEFTDLKVENEKIVIRKAKLLNSTLFQMDIADIK